VAVLSVAAPPLLALQRALRADHPAFSLDGEQPTCAVFATMNPPVVPHAEVICNIRLYSHGYASAKELAGKMAAALELLRDVFSGLPHYDFSLRFATALF
ncbi:hypothetical protein T492DRAFT_859687, partial [Pavlovales sp. CCMP2436]